MIKDPIINDIRKYLEQNYPESVSDSNVESIYEFYDSMSSVDGLNVPDTVDYWIGNE